MLLPLLFNYVLGILIFGGLYRNLLNDEERINNLKNTFIVSYGFEEDDFKRLDILCTVCILLWPITMIILIVLYLLGKIWEMFEKVLICENEYFFFFFSYIIFSYIENIFLRTRDTFFIPSTNTHLHYSKTPKYLYMNELF